MGGSSAQLLLEETLGAALFLSSRQRRSANGISERSILSKVNRMGVSLMARCCPVPVSFTERRTMAGRMASESCTSYRRGQLANGQRECSIALKAEATEIVLSVILFSIQFAIFAEQLAKVVQAVAPCLN